MAAGILVSKAGMTDATDKVLFEQVANYPKALGMSAFMAGALGFLPGTPALPFLLLATLTGATAYYLDKQQKAARQRAAECLNRSKTRRDCQGCGRTDCQCPAHRPDSPGNRLWLLLPPLINETNRKLTDQIKAFAPSLGQRTWFCYAVNPHSG